MDNPASRYIKKTILVVDDSESVRSHIRVLLEPDYNIVTRNDGHEALVYLSQGNYPDLILTDMEMPNMNGRTFVRRVKSNPRHSNIPIIFITSVKSDMLINSFTNMGVIDFIIKPYEPEDVISKVKKVVMG